MTALFTIAIVVPWHARLTMRASMFALWLGLPLDPEKIVRRYLRSIRFEVRS